MEAAIKHLEEEQTKRKSQRTLQSNQSETTVGKKPSSAQRMMNSSGSSFKQQASATEVRAGAQEDMEKLSLSSS